MLDAADLPDDIAALNTRLIAAEAREVRKDERIERLEKLVAAFKRTAFGRKSEKADPEQPDLALEDLETAIAAVHAEDEADCPSGKQHAKPRAINRGSLPAHLPCIEEIIEPESLVCACGGYLPKVTNKSTAQSAGNYVGAKHRLWAAAESADLKFLSRINR